MPEIRLKQASLLQILLGYRGKFWITIACPHSTHIHRIRTSSGISVPQSLFISSSWALLASVMHCICSSVGGSGSCRLSVVIIAGVPMEQTAGDKNQTSA